MLEERNDRLLKDIYSHICRNQLLNGQNKAKRQAQRYATNAGKIKDFLSMAK